MHEPQGGVKSGEHDLKHWLAVLAVVAGCTQAPIVALAPTPMATVRQEQVDGRNVVRMIPPSPKAIIYLFHGSGGAETFATNPTTQRVLERFVAAGYGYAASASLQRTEPRRWDLTSIDPKTNPDVAYMLALHRRLIAAGEIEATTPVFTMGMSNGGGMANLFALAAKKEGLPVKAVGDYMGPFPAPMSPVIEGGLAPAPTFIVVAEHDGLVSAANVLAASERVKKAGTKIETHLVKEVALRPSAFADLEGVDAKTSESIFSDLVARGLVDSNGKRLAFADQAVISREDMAVLIARLAPGQNQRGIERVLMQTWAAHMMRADYAAQQFAFFEAALRN